MGTLDRKLWRELGETKGQSLAIAAVVASGVAVFVMALSTLQFLKSTRDAYYDRYRFGHVFAQLRRAPEHVGDQLEAIPQVAVVQTRIVNDVTLDVPGLAEPATGRLISIPALGASKLNAVYLRAGRFPERSKDREVLVGEAFALANSLEIGDSLDAILNGRKQQLLIVGVALTPEYVFPIRPGDILPDDRRFGLFWMHEEQLAAAFDMDGAFNDVSLQLLRGANVDDVIMAIDRILEPYGCLGAFSRDDQLSASFLDDEIKQLQGMALVAPIIFLGVAAFLLNVVLSRRIGTQREIIATLKAFGLGNWEIAWHYLKTALLVTLGGALIGAVGGNWLASGLAKLYSEFYKFPEFQYQPNWRVGLLAVFVSLVAAFVGAWRGVATVLRLMPAEAMRPAAPAKYRPSWIERVGLARFVPLTVKMIARQMGRRPLQSAFSVFGIASAVAVLLMGNFSPDAIAYLLDFQFRTAQRQDVQVVFENQLSRAAYYDLQHLAGVNAVEPYRAVPVKMRFEHRERRVSILGLGARRDLYRLLNSDARPIRLPSDGLVLSDTLAKMLAVQEGDWITCETLDGEQETYRLRVAGLSREYAGLNAYADLNYLHRTLGESNVLTGAFMSVQASSLDELYQQLKNTPAVASVAVKEATIKQFEETVSENLMKFQAFNIIFAAVIAVGVVYNTARVSLDERSRELSTMRVIGFTRTEVAVVLLGELALLTAIAIPLGWAIGYAFCSSMVAGFETEQFRIPLVIRPQSFASSALITMLAALVSGLLVRRRLDALDLVEVLKSRE